MKLIHIRIIVSLPPGISPRNRDFNLHLTEYFKQCNMYRRQLHTNVSTTKMGNYTFPINIPTVYNHEFPTRRPFTIQCRLIVLCKISKFFAPFLFFDLMELGDSDCCVMCHFQFLFLDHVFYFTEVHLKCRLHI